MSKLVSVKEVCKVNIFKIIETALGILVLIGIISFLIYKVIYGRRFEFLSPWAKKIMKFNAENEEKYKSYKKDQTDKAL